MIGAALTLIAWMTCAPQATAVEASATLVRVTTDDRAGVQIGERLLFTVTLEGAAAKGARLAKKRLDLGYAWSVVDGPRPVVEAALAASARPAVQLQWTVIALESGQVTTPPVKFKLPGDVALSVPSATLDVVAEMDEGEDAPRPMLGFREVEDRRLGDPRLALAAGLGLLLLPILIVGVVRYRRRPKAGADVASGPTPLEAIDALDAAGDPRLALVRLGPLVRRAIDERLGSDGAALTDEEWASALSSAGSLSEEDRSAAIKLVRELSVVRFGGADPTSFAAKDAVERAQRLATFTVADGEAKP